jgi:beta-N-acetylhexosaminidase
MRSILLLLVLGGVLFGASGSQAQAQTPTPSSGDLIDKLLQSLTPEQKVEQLFIVGFNGPDVSPDTQQYLATHQVGGVYLSQETCNVVNGTTYDPKHCAFPNDANPDTPAQVAQLTADLQKASCDATQGSVDGAPYCLPLIVSVDHEGDGWPSTRLLNRFTPIPSNMAIGATFDPAQAQAVGCIVGQELSAVGVNMLFGPDLDVLDSPQSGGPGDQGIRVFGGDARWVGEMGAAYVQGVQQCADNRLATVAKHFPGHGRSARSIDYPDVPVVVGKSLDALAQVDLVPFSVVAQGKPGDAGIADGIMNSHLSYPEVPGCDGKTPAPLSASCMQTFYSLPVLTAWRQAGGLTVADDLATGAVTAYAQEKFGTYPQAEIAFEALMAGNDLLPLIRPWQWEDLQATVDYLVSRYEADGQVKQRVDDAVRRILTLKSRLYGGLDPAAVTKAPDYQGKVGQPASLATVSSIVEKGLTLIRPSTVEELQKTVPVPSVGQRILFVECWDDPACAMPTDVEGYPPLWPRGKLASLLLEMFPGRVAKENVNTISFSQLGDVLAGKGDPAVRDAVTNADWLVFAFLERDPTTYPASDVLKDFLGRGPTLFDLRSKKVVVFAYNSPYHLDAGELRNVDLFVAAYTKIEPALRASLNVLFQDPTVFGDGGGGQLPVDYIYGDYVLSDLSERVKADPSQTLQVATDPAEPVAGQPFAVALTQPLLALNSHRVPNGAKVDFAFELPDGSVQIASAQTTDGLAKVSLTVPQSGKVRLTVKSDDLTWSPSEPLVVARPGESPGSGGGIAMLPLVLAVSMAGVVVVVALGTFSYRLRRRRALVPVSAGVPEAPVAEVGGDLALAEPEKQADQELHLDSTAQRVFVKGRELVPPLSREQYALLSFLFEHAGSLCLRDDIIQRAWPGSYGGVSDEAVDALVHRVRERLRAAGASKLLISTVRGRGFRLDL